MSDDVLRAPAPHPGAVRAAFFDVDNTVIRGASAYQLARELFRRGFFRRRDILRFGWMHLKYLTVGETKDQAEEVHDRAAAFIAGRTVAEITAVGEEVYDTVLGLRIYPGTLRLIDEHLAAGYEVWFVTATPVEIGRLIARRMGATGCLGTVAEHRGGVYTGRIVGNLMHGEHKAEAVRELAARTGIDLAASYAYSDSLNDLPMMNLVGNPCAINPDLKLRRHASDVGWPIREFRGRGRRVWGRSLRSASLAGGVWVGGVIWRQLRKRLAAGFQR
ncbi:MAG: HAD-IB family hydrolase [Promicromonosporaceae bacterium]|nr:HAD-IB family hydrolase [Promicromonosporaceae bacterium]